MTQAPIAPYNPPMLARRTLLGSLGTLPLTRIAWGQAAHRLTIIHLNDFHSRHDPVNGATLACNLGAAGCFGGSPRLATAIAAQRRAAEADGRAVLQLDAGDQFQGSLFYTALHGDAELAVMHAVGTEAMAVGNHEFDNGPANLARFIANARFPVLSANMTAGGVLAGMIQPYALFDRAGLKLAVVGLTTPETLTTSSPGPDVQIGDPAAAMAQASAAARAAGAQVVIALSHLGIAADQALAAGVPGIAAIIGGHSHTLLSNVEAGAAGPHPTVVGKTLIVQAGAYGRYLGRLDLDLAADGAVLAYGGECRHIGADIDPDPAVAAIVAGYAAPLEAARRQVLGQAPALGSPAGCRIAECALGDFVADAILAGARGADVAIMNAGGIRTGLPEGAVTRGDVIGMLPFGNTLSVLRIRGADLRAALLHGLSLVGRGGFPQTAGLRIGWNPVDAAATTIAVRGADGQYQPLDPGRDYTLVTNDFTRSGGDGYTVLRDRAIDPYDTGPALEDLVAAHIQAGAAMPAGGRLVLGQQ